jgi:hypothetical protein
MVIATSGLNQETLKGKEGLFKFKALENPRENLY